MRLLLVEDNVIDQQAFIRFVKRNRLPYQYVIRNSLHDARQQIGSQEFDIIVCDYRLGDGTALDLVQTFPDPPIIVTTGAGDEAVAVSLIKAGAKDYLVKDIEGQYLRVLPTAIQSIMRQRALEISERNQRVLTELLHKTARTLNSTLELNETLRIILESIKPIIPHHAANIMLITEGLARIVQCNSCALETASSLASIAFDPEEHPHLSSMLRTRQPYIIDDIPTYIGWKPVKLEYEPLSYLAAPICIDDEVIGFINLDSLERNHFTPDHAFRLQVFVDYAAVALKNARMYQQTQELVALRERQRLARDLHDSVTQTLFAASAISNALVRQCEPKSGIIFDSLHQLRDLTTGALAELRTLLFELRPNALSEADLGALLYQLTTAVKAHTYIQVSFDSQGECSLPPNVHIAFFRIAQEALNNVVKHARASHVEVILKRIAAKVELTIQDNGRGFDHTRETPQTSLGIHIMRERAAEAQIELSILSRQTEGTTVRAIWLNKDQP